MSVSMLFRSALSVFTAMTMLLSMEAAAREKLDVIMLRNSDKITGEIVELRYGQLSVKTDSMGTVKIEWLDIASIDSPQRFFVESNTGDRYKGNLVATPEAGRIRIAAEPEAVDLPVAELAVVSQLEPGFIDRVNGSISAGFQETKSSDTRSLTMGFETEYRGDRFFSNLDGNYSGVDTPGQGTQNQFSLNAGSQYLRPNDLYWIGLTSFESNEEQGIDGRLLMAAARGKYWMRREDSEFSTFFGVGFAQEWAAGDGDNQQSIEGVLGLYWKIFRFKDPETTLSSRLLVLPSLSESGRYRANTSISLDHELVDDLYVDLSLNASYDNEPPDVTADTIDYNITTSVKYKF